jgi:hypothetical protein
VILRQDGALICLIMLLAIYEDSFYGIRGASAGELIGNYFNGCPCESKTELGRSPLFKDVQVVNQTGGIYLFSGGIPNTSDILVGNVGHAGSMNTDCCIGMNRSPAEGWGNYWGKWETLRKWRGPDQDCGELLNFVGWGPTGFLRASTRWALAPSLRETKPFGSTERYARSCRSAISSASFLCFSPAPQRRRVDHHRVPVKMAITIVPIATTSSPLASTAVAEQSAYSQKFIPCSDFSLRFLLLS